MNSNFHNQNTLPSGATLRKDNVDKPPVGEAFIMEQEIWKDIVGYEGIYKVSNLGRVKRISSQHILSQTIDKYGYLRAHLSYKCKAKKRLVHRLVMAAFVGIDNREVDHINGDKKDNRMVNLEYVSTRENQLRLKERNGSSSGVRGVGFHKHTGKWQSEIMHKNVRYYLGIFDTEKEAGAAYIKKLNELENERRNKSSDL